MSGRQRGFQENFKHCRSVSSQSAESRKNDPDGISVLVSEVAPEHCCLVFCSTKKNCESVAKLISSNLSPNLLQWKTAEKLKLRRALEVKSISAVIPRVFLFLVKLMLICTL